MPTAPRPTTSMTMHRRVRRGAVMLLTAFLAAAFFTVVPAVPRARAGGGPMFIAHVSTSTVAGHGWQPNSQVMITIAFPWVPDIVHTAGPISTDGSGSFDISNVGYFLHPHSIVTVADGIRTKTLVVADIWGAESDEAADTVSGLASPNEEIRTWVAGIPNKAVNTTADSTGRWTVDYGGVWDLVTGTVIGLEDYDADGDVTATQALLPIDADVDQDTVPNLVDNCPRMPNTTQYDGDGDGIGARCDDVDRIWGPDRYWTAAAVAEMAFDTADTVFLALGTNFPDALVAAAAGGYLDGPVLLTGKDTLPPATIAELQRLTPNTAYIVGGTAVIDPVVEQLVGSLVPNVIRLAGPDRYATAVAVSAAIFPPGNEAFLATGEDFPDALVAAAAAGYDKSPVLLTRRDGAPQQTLDELARLHPSTIYIVGGTAVISEAVAQQAAAYGNVVRLAGPDRYATAAAVQVVFGMNHSRAFLAYGRNFPDALVAAAAGGHLLAPVLLVEHDSIPAASMDEIWYRSHVWIVGGTAVIGDEVSNALP